MNYHQSGTVLQSKVLLNGLNVHTEGSFFGEQDIPVLRHLEIAFQTLSLTIANFNSTLLFTLILTHSLTIHLRLIKSTDILI